MVDLPTHRKLVYLQANVAEKIAADKLREKLQIALKLLDCDVVFNIRHAFETGLLPEARGVVDIGLSTLILIAAGGTYTGVHVDWTDAYNLGIPLAETPQGADVVLAGWYPLLIDEEMLLPESHAALSVYVL